MKKMMIVLTTVALGLSVQAAQISWKTGTGIKAPTSAEDGTFGSKNAGSGTLAMYVWLVSQETYDSITVGNGDIYAGYKDGSLGTASGSKSGASGTTGVTVETKDLAFDTEKNTPYYGLILMTYDDGNGVVAYIENKAVTEINTAGSNMIVANLGKTASNWAIPSDQSGVPEPTSGLLLVMGGALLALHRKQK